MKVCLCGRDACIGEEILLEGWVCARTGKGGATPVDDPEAKVQGYVDTEKLGVYNPTVEKRRELLLP